MSSENELVAHKLQQRCFMYALLIAQYVLLLTACDALLSFTHCYMCLPGLLAERCSSCYLYVCLSVTMLLIALRLCIAPDQGFTEAHAIVSCNCLEFASLAQSQLIAHTSTVFTTLQLEPFT